MAAAKYLACHCERSEAIPEVLWRALEIASSLPLLAMTDLRRLCYSPALVPDPLDTQSSAQVCQEAGRVVVTLVQGEPGEL